MQEPSLANREALRSCLAPDTTIWQYTHGVPDVTAVSPDCYSLDNFHLARPGAGEIQLDLFGGTVEIGGPEQFRVDELVRRRLAALKDPREVNADPNARYSGAKLSEKTLVPGNNARLGETRFETWLTQPAAQAQKAA